MKKFPFDRVGNILLDLIILGIGVLFFTNNPFSWSIVYVVFLIFLFYHAVSTILKRIQHKEERKNSDFFTIVMDLGFAAYTLFHPEQFLSWIHVFFGWWMMATGLFSFVDCYVCKKDHLAGVPSKFFIGFTSVLLAIFMIWVPRPNGKTWILSLFAGIYFIIYGFMQLMEHSSVLLKENGKKGRTGWSISLPILLNAFLPLAAYTSIKRLIADSGKELNLPTETSDLQVYVYLNGSGPESFGHLDISYHDTIYSYGCHDPNRRQLFGTLGDGVLIRSDRKDFLQEALHDEKKIILGYGIRLTDEEKKKLEDRIQSLMDRTTPWLCPAAQAEKDGKDITEIKDYASRVYKGTHCEMFKFTKGKFRTYFVGSTNCVLLADALLRCKDFYLIDLNGFVTPGSYLSFLNQQYLQHSDSVVSRVLYQEGFHEAK